MDVVSLEQPPPRPPLPAGASGVRMTCAPRFYFDLASPYTYLAAERAERTVPRAALAAGVLRALQSRRDGRRRASASTSPSARQQLGLPIVWPVGPPVRVVGAMRVASLAAEQRQGRGVRAGREPAHVLRRLRHRRRRRSSPRPPPPPASSSARCCTPRATPAATVAIEEAGRRLLAAGADRTAGAARRGAGCSAARTACPRPLRPLARPADAHPRRRAGRGRRAARSERSLGSARDGDRARRRRDAESSRESSAAISSPGG